jgi:hypothetical protein
MPPLLRKFLRFILYVVPVGLFEHALFGWGNAHLGITDPLVDHIVRLALEYGLPAITVGIGFAIYQVFEHVAWPHHIGSGLFDAEGRAG